RETVPHRPPLLTTRTASYTTDGHCQEVPSINFPTSCPETSRVLSRNLAGPVPGSGSRARRTLPAPPLTSDHSDVGGAGPRGTRGSRTTRSPVPPARRSSAELARSGELFRRLLPVPVRLALEEIEDGRRRELRTIQGRWLPT